MNSQATHEVIIRPMRRDDLDEADRTFRLAFGTRLGLPDPSQFRGDAELLRPRWAAYRAAGFVAEIGGRVIGSSMGMDWGSVFVIGPVSVHPQYSGRGIARLLMPPLMELSNAHGARLSALFTFPSPTHIRLYESYGFAANFLTPVMSKRVEGEGGDIVPRYSILSPSQRADALAQCRVLSDAIFEGLDLSHEIQAIADEKLGDMILLCDKSALAGFALCHIGAGSEAGSGNLYVKFAAVRPGAPQDFIRLLSHCETLARRERAGHVIAGVNMGRSAAYRLMQQQNYRADLIGVAMHRPGQEGYNRPDIFVIDDLR